MISMKVFAWTGLLILELALTAGTIFGAWVFWGRAQDLQEERAPLASEISVSPEMCNFSSDETSRFLYLSLDSSEFLQTKQALLQLAAKEGREIVQSSESEATSFVAGRGAVTQQTLYLAFSTPLEDADALSQELRDLPPSSLKLGTESSGTQSLRVAKEECERTLYLSRTLQLYEQFYLRQIKEKGGYDEELGDKVNQMRTTAFYLQESLNYYRESADKLSVTITLREDR